MHIKVAPLMMFCIIVGYCSKCSGTSTVHSKLLALIRSMYRKYAIHSTTNDIFLPVSFPTEAGVKIGTQTQNHTYCYTVLSLCVSPQYKRYAIKDS
jgi:hypothetical protein